VSSAELKKAKRAVRRRILARRDALSPRDVEVRGAAIAARALDLEEVRSAARVLAFWSFGSEVPTAPLLAGLWARGVSVTLPRIEDGDLRVRTYADGDPLTATSFGAMEPARGAEVDPADLDVIVTPGVAFDRQGRRIGYGGGFYDRLFPRAPRAARIAIAFDLQVVDVPLPAAAFDLPVHAIVTETAVLRAPAAG
jgi:5-formyltetrahydrofolate cyclo-ligase